MINFAQNNVLYMVRGQILSEAIFRDNRRFKNHCIKIANYAGAPAYFSLRAFGWQLIQNIRRPSNHPQSFRVANASFELFTNENDPIEQTGDCIVVFATEDIVAKSEISLAN